MTNNIFASGLRFERGSELLDWRIDTLREKEPETLAWLETLRVKSAPALIDIGANIGIYSLYAAAAMQEHDGAVLAVEPQYANYRVLLSNIRLNPHLRVFPLHAGVNSVPGLTGLTVKDARPGASGGQVANSSDQEALRGTSANGDAAEMDDGIEGSEIELISTFTLDYLGSMLTSTNIYIKIDVDGLEASILKSGEKLLADERTLSVLVEFNHPDEEHFWSQELAACGLRRDYTFESLAGHSSTRRQRTGQPARNVIFSR